VASSQVYLQVVKSRGIRRRTFSEQLFILLIRPTLHPVPKALPTPEKLRLEVAGHSGDSLHVLP
jgi:hypothetical protein